MSAKENLNVKESFRFLGKRFLQGEGGERMSTLGVEGGSAIKKSVRFKEPEEAMTQEDREAAVKSGCSCC